jgi:hypothetical protein
MSLNCHLLMHVDIFTTKICKWIPIFSQFYQFFVKKKCWALRFSSFNLFVPLLKKGNWQENFSACVVTLITGQQPGRQGGLTESSFDQKIEPP